MTPQDIVNFDVRPWFEKSGATPNISPHHAPQGLEAMIRAIRAKPLHLAKLKGQLSSGWLHIAGWSMVYTGLHRGVLVSGEHKRHPTFQRESPANTGGLQ